MQNIEEIYKDYFKIVYKYLFCLTHNEDLAEDLTQETFCIAVKNIDKFKNDCKISVWMCQIGKHLWYKELKKHKQNNIISIEEIETLPSDVNIVDEVINKEERVFLYKQIQRLDEQTKEVMHLRLIGELSFKEIGEILNKSETWARVTFYRGKQKIKEVDYNECE